MRRLSSQQLFLVLFAVAVSSYYLSVSASVSHLKISLSRQILSCEALRKIHRDLDPKSAGKLREYLYKQFRSSTKARPAEAYALAKYYGCRFPDENDDFAIYLKGWVKRYEEAILKREAEETVTFENIIPTLHLDRQIRISDSGKGGGNRTGKYARTTPGQGSPANRTRPELFGQAYR